MTRQRGKSRWGRALQRRFLTVEFDSRQMRLAVFDRGTRQPRLRKVAAVAMPEGIDLDNAGDVGRFLATVLTSRSLPDVPLVMCVPRGQAVLKPLTLPPGTERDEVAAMVQFQVQGEIPFGPEETALDFTVEGIAPGEATAGGLDVLAAAVRTGTVEYYRQVAASAGLKLLRLGLRPHAVARCVEVAGACRDDAPQAVVLITSDETEIEIMCGTHLVYSRSAVVKMAPGEMPPAIAQVNGAEPPESEPGLAAMLDVAPGVPADAEPSGPDENLPTKLQGLVSEVARSLQGYLAMHPDGRIGSILVAGGTGVEADVVQRLSGQFECPVRLFDPAGALPARKQEHLEAFVACAGLAHGWRDETRAPFDFLNPKKPIARRDPARMRKILGGVAAAVLLIAIIALSSVWVGGKAATVARLVARKTEATEEKPRVEKLISRVDAIRKWRDERQDWLDHWAKLSAVLPGAEDAYIDGIDTGADYVKFTVRARDSEVITSLIAKLQEAGYNPKPGKDAQDDRNRFGYIRTAEVTVYLGEAGDVDVSELDAPGRPADDNPRAPLRPRRGRRRG